jgi:hypothetical protein
MKVRRCKQVFSKDGTSDGGRHKERVNENEYGGCIMCSYMKTEE